MNYTGVRDGFASGSVTVTNALNHDSVYHYDTIKSRRRIVRVDRAAHTHPAEVDDSCEAAGQYTRHDNNGQVELVVDWEGNGTNYNYDINGLEIQRTEGLDTQITGSSITTLNLAETRTISQQWHPDFRLPTRVVDAETVTDTVYDCVTGRITQRNVYNAATAPPCIAPSCS